MGGFVATSEGGRSSGGDAARTGRTLDVIERGGHGALRDNGEVREDADLRLNGVLRVSDLGLRLVFAQIGDRAAAGLRRVLGAPAATTD